MSASFCPNCGSATEEHAVAGRARPVCSACGHVVYLDPKLVVATIVETADRLLLIRRAMEPGLGLWTFPSGYVDRGEAVEEAATREVEEETGLRVQLTGLVGVYSQANDPVVLLVYAAQPVSGTLRSGNETQGVGFFPSDGLPPLAFPRDREIIEQWHRQQGQQR